jgi:hypothetical protein
MSPVEWAWRRQSVWSQTANRLKSETTGIRSAGLVLTVVAAVLALAGSQVRSASVAASVLLAVFAAVTLAGCRADPEPVEHGADTPVDARAVGVRGA